MANFGQRMTVNEMKDSIARRHGNGFTEFKRHTANTFEFRVGNRRILRYHNTEIVVWNTVNETIMFNSGGSRGATTKRKMNEHSVVGPYQRKGVWYVQDRFGATSEFYDGIVFDCNTGKFLEKEYV